MPDTIDEDQKPFRGELDLVNEFCLELLEGTTAGIPDEPSGPLFPLPPYGLPVGDSAYNYAYKTRRYFDCKIVKMELFFRDLWFGLQLQLIPQETKSLLTQEQSTRNYT